MGRALRYITPNRHPEYGKLALRSPAAIWGTAYYDGSWNRPRPVPAPAPTPFPFPLSMASDPVRELHNAEAGMREAVRVYDFARRAIGTANATHTAPIMANGCIAIPAKPFTPERVRDNKRLAFTLFNRRRAQLLAARRRLNAAQLACNQENKP